MQIQVCTNHGSRGTDGATMGHTKTNTGTRDLIARGELRLCIDRHPLSCAIQKNKISKFPCQPFFLLSSRVALHWVNFDGCALGELQRGRGRVLSKKKAAKGDEEETRSRWMSLIVVRTWPIFEWSTLKHARAPMQNRQKSSAQWFLTLIHGCIFKR